MRLISTFKGYRSTWDRRLQFYRCYIPRELRRDWVNHKSEIRWEVRCNGQAGEHWFPHLRSAKAFAREWCLNNLEGAPRGGESLARLFEKALVARTLLRAFLLDEEVVVNAFLDLAAEFGEDHCLNQAWLDRFRREMAPLPGERQHLGQGCPDSPCRQTSTSNGKEEAAGLTPVS